MIHPMTWPAPLHPLVHADDLPAGSLVADTTRTVTAFQLRADLISDLLAWSGGDVDIVDGAPALRLPNGDVVHLGDYVLRDTPDAPPHGEPADGFWTRWCPAEGRA